MNATDRATVRDRTARGWPEDRWVGRSVCTSRVQEPEEAMGLECLERLQGRAREVRETFYTFISQHAVACMGTHARAQPTNEWSVSDGHGADDQSVSSQRVLGQLGVSLVVEVRGI